MAQRIIRPAKGLKFISADARLTPSARELLESRHLRIKFIDEQGSLLLMTKNSSRSRCMV